MNEHDGHAAPDSGSGPRRVLDEVRAAETERRTRQALDDFADHPRRAVQELDTLLAEACGWFTDALTDRRHALRQHWRGEGGSASTTVGPDDLRHALAEYRDLLLRLSRL
ncbi:MULTISPECIES: hypothetical protein [Streptomycetaceae]|uniref:Uncharacterized protein n=1 Tax=Streptantibioticus cattleyicolor (strain ATCC 35852 / DSM 46488 / JCM 4925 / NBRC 14057 / NRRL 8057) TaxID=1003195 RepID=F8JYQ5_STREN|nr:MULTISPECIES: hypothetical protein [Streptomycetaceae]AEW93820.1 hypothetical protein SCATT_14490 [Streptantibioticus cattleyicolor NRRL 8057 = DSM 46488]MYS58504.1 hypothetical protein [Streptomyces sp. SID5468]CCB74166.1 protein of unknown function [Streptantibioticus cattleyicolor NRRL 8057 = DSM 46488]